MTGARRLAAILAADVVGYSRLMGEDEAGTARAVRERREAVEVGDEEQYFDQTGRPRKDICKMRLRQSRGWLLEPAGHSFVMGALALSYLYFLIILNRWVVTDLGLKSFGRVWQFYVSYGEIGFVRRGLLGTILSLTRLNSTFSNEYVFAYAFTAVLGLFSVVLLYLIVKGARLSRATSFGIALSPALTAHLAYATGSMDLVLFILLLVAVLNITNIFVILSTIGVGVLVNELFLFYVPFIVVMYWAYTIDAARRKLISSTLILVYSAAILFAMSSLSVTPPTYAEYASLMATKLPNAVGLPYWDGYWELFVSAAQQLNEDRGHFQYLFDPLGVLSLSLPVGYALFLIFICVDGCLKQEILFKVALAFSLIFPFFIFLIASDYLRWVCMSATVSLITIVMLTRRGYLNVPPRYALALPAFCAFSPFGSAIIFWPLPMHQFVIEKFMHFFK